MKSIALLEPYLEERNQLLRTISELLERDPGVKAAWLSGSIGREVEDALSDIDLWVIIYDEPIREIITQPRQVASQISTPVLFLEAPQNAPEGGAYLMTCYDAPVAPHIVDWYWQPQSLAYISSGVRLLFDRVGLIHKDQPIQFQDRPEIMGILERPIHFISFFWMMLMVTAKKAFRSPWAERMDLSPLLDSIGKAQHFLGQDSFLLSRDIPPHQLPREKMQLLYKLADRMSELMEIIAKHGEEVPDLIKPGAYRYLNLIESIIEDQEK